MFQVGDRVTWGSQAGGRHTEKTGKVVRVLTEVKWAGTHGAPQLWPAAIADREFPGHRRMFDGHAIPGCAETGYLIEVVTSKRAKPRLYMPYPSKLKKAE